MLRRWTAKAAAAKVKTMQGHSAGGGASGSRTTFCLI
jgi:hypothetical protein